MDGLTLRQKRQYAGSLGGLQKAINAAADPAAATERARQEFLAKFGTRHVCALGCDVTIPPDLSDQARERAARLAQRAHFQRMVWRREQKRHPFRRVK